MEKTVIAAASYYNQKYFVNPEFNDIPTEIRNELRLICINLSEKLHCAFFVGFTDAGTIYFETRAEEADYDYDEIGADLEIKELGKTHSELIRTLQLWYTMYKTKEGNEILKSIRT